MLHFCMALSRCLLSLSQKLKAPSDPAVTNVPNWGWKHMAFTAYTSLLSLPHGGGVGEELPGLGEKGCGSDPPRSRSPALFALGTFLLSTTRQHTPARDSHSPPTHFNPPPPTTNSQCPKC